MLHLQLGKTGAIFHQGAALMQFYGPFGFCWCWIKNHSRVRCWMLIPQNVASNQPITSHHITQWSLAFGGKDCAINHIYIWNRVLLSVITSSGAVSANIVWTHRPRVSLIFTDPKHLLLSGSGPTVWRSACQPIVSSWFLTPIPTLPGRPFGAVGIVVALPGTSLAPCSCWRKRWFVQWFRKKWWYHQFYYNWLGI